jgi:potassium/hydrogen antiporter
LIAFEYILLVVSVLIIISIFLSRYSDNLGVPSLVLFLIIGMLAGSDGPGKIYFDNYFVAQYAGILSLIFILFSGGLGTKWSEVKSIKFSAISLSTIGVVITAGAIGFVIHYVTGLKLHQGLLIGAIISSTDAAAVFSVIRGSKTGIKGNIKPLLELESGTNDPVAIMLTLILIEYSLSNEVTVLSTVIFLLMQLVIGLASGFIFGKLISLYINKFKFSHPGFYPVFLISSSVLVYAVTVSVHGSGMLAVYVSGVILANSEFVQKKSLIRFIDGLAMLGQIVMFLTLGLLVYPTRLYTVIGEGLIVSGFLIFFARPIGVFISLIFSKFSFKEKSFISWVGLRGAVPIILATFPLTAGLDIGHYIFNLVFFITLTSALIQGWSIPFAAKLFHVRGQDIKQVKAPLEIDDTLKSNNDLLDIIIPYNSPALGKSLAELNLPPESLITVIYRNDDYIVPSGSTVIEEGDTILILVNKNNVEKVKTVFMKIK